MTIYWLLVGFLLLAGFLLKPNRSQIRRKYFLLIAFLALFLVSGFRGFSVGADTGAYVSYFKSIQDMDTGKDRYEAGYRAFAWMLHNVSDNPQILLIVSSAVCVGAACLITYCFSKDPALSVVLYVLLGSYFSQMNIMRQALALSILEIAFVVFLKGRGLWSKIISALLIWLATQFHEVAFVGFIPYFLMMAIQGKRGKYSAVKILLIGCTAAVVSFTLYSIVVQLTAMFFPAYIGYFVGEWSDSNYNASLFNTLIQVAFAAAGMMIFGRKRLDPVQRFDAVMLSLAILFSTLSMRMEIWERLSSMCGIYTYLLWAPEFVGQMRSAKDKLFMKTAMVIFSSAYMLTVLIYRPEWNAVVPYYFG